LRNKEVISRFLTEVQMITVTDRAKEYLKRKGGDMYIAESRNTSICCGRINFGPAVHRGTPVNLKDFSKTVINGINVYLPNKFESPFPLTVDVRRFLFIRSLYLEGWKQF
jgi:hypothetical protein